MLQLIHKTHSKKDIVEIIELLSIPIEDPVDLNKHQLQTKVIKYCNEQLDKLFLPNHLFIQSMENLIEHLTNINQRKINGTDTRANVMRKAKKLTQYQKSDYIFFQKGYMFIEDVIEDIEYVLPFGDFPSVRKAIRNINNDPKLVIKYFPVISEKMKRIIQDKKEAKQQTIGGAVFRRAPPGQPFVIRFD